MEIETGALLRRQIARRCIYGLDLNLMAVELARLAIWIHTFVPGLPMSALDHNLVVGNSLTGIGTIDEVLDVLEPQRRPGQASFFADEITAALEAAKERLMRAARTAEATKAEVREAARAHAKAMEDAADAKALLDAAVGVRLGVVPLPAGPERAISAGNSASVQDKIAELQAAQLPYLFPEVFLRDHARLRCADRQPAVGKAAGRRALVLLSALPWPTRALAGSGGDRNRADPGRPAGPGRRIRAGNRSDCRP